MSFSGWSTSNFIRQASALLATTPLTIACFGKTPTLATLQYMVGVFASGSAANRNCFALAVQATNAPIAAAANGSSFTGPSGTAISANTWFHACGVWTSAASRTIYVDGANPVTNTTSLTPSSQNRTSVGLGDGSSAASPWLGQLAEIGIWNAALNADEIAALSKGVPPPRIRPGSLVSYMPLVRGLVDIKGNSFAVQGSLSAADHCRIYGMAA